MKLGLLTFNTVADVMTGRTTLRRLCRAAAENGIAEFDMMASEIKLFGANRVLNALTDAGLTLGCLIAHIPMADKKEEKIAKLTERALKLALQMRSPLLMIVPMTAFGAAKLRPRDKENIFAAYARYYAAAVEAARGSGVTVCFEDTPTCYLPLSTTAECGRLLDAVPGLGLVCDTANMLPGGSEPLAFYEKLKSRVVRAHLKDARFIAKGQDRCADGRFLACCDFGDGVVPVRELCACLQADGCPAAAIEYTKPQHRSHSAHIHDFVEFLGL